MSNFFFWWIILTILGLIKSQNIDFHTNNHDVSILISNNLIRDITLFYIPTIKQHIYSYNIDAQNNILFQTQKGKITEFNFDNIYIQVNSI